MSDERYKLNTTGNGGEENKINLVSGETMFSFLQSGDLFEITHGQAMINQIRGNLVDGSMNNIYLRIYDEAENINSVKPMIGIQSGSRFFHGNSQVQWIGASGNVAYKVTFTLASEGIWFWKVEVDAGDKVVDVLYGQDVGLANRGMIQSNEAYTSQYVDYKVFDHEKYGYVVCSRQNQPQGEGKFPYLQQGALTKATSYSTDGYQFFGLSYKETNSPESIFKEKLASEVYQYEFGYVGLTSIKGKGEFEAVFYGVAKDTQTTAVTELEYLSMVEATWEKVCPNQLTEKPQVKLKNNNFFSPITTEKMTMAEINSLYPERVQEEFDGDTLLSFFTPTYEHVVLKEKEMQVERSHGHILFSGDNLTVNDEIITTTSYMYGVFNAQVVVGNTTMNKLLSNARNGLNVMKTSGQRIYVDMGVGYQLLTMPSAFEMGFNYVRWYYKTDLDTLMITNFTGTRGSDVILNVTSTSGSVYRYMITNQIVMNEKEYEIPFRMVVDEQTLTFKTVESGFVSNYYPELTYHLNVDGAKMTVNDEKALLDGVETTSASLVVLELEATNEFTITMQGKINGGEFDSVKREFASEVVSYRNHFATVMNGFKLSQNGVVNKDLEKLNITAWWYTHNMFVHYLVPHGLEQYGGAAWGTRDVCQGPFEYFLAMGRHDVMRQILIRVFSHQFEDDGNWPQWFMFDKYVNIHAADAHGDIIAWPLYVIGTYLNITGDYSILDEKIPYLSRETHQFTTYTESLFDHIKKEIDYIKANFLHDTHLSCYGDGDWDDTLQPHDAKLKTYMASSWTVGLTYKGMKGLALAFTDEMPKVSKELSELASGIEADFRKYIMSSDVIPGFLYLEDPEKPEFMIHPTDEKLGIDYRLLPMQQSVISELFTPAEAASHLQIIREHLKCPDGVRLMNKPATYSGGVSTKFKRAEQASNFGREVGLQYVHAHIRFIEAMAKLGEADEAWDALMVINPINIKDQVPNAEIRQSNAYFSSSDGKFNDRYEASANFGKLRTGDVMVKGGWRIYSSGPGIYLNQLISNMLGIRQVGKALVIDPILPAELNGLKFEFMVEGKKVIFTYHLGSPSKKVVVNKNEVETKAMTNTYREGGVRIDLSELGLDLNTLELWM